LNRREHSFLFSSLTQKKDRPIFSLRYNGAVFSELTRHNAMLCEKL